MICPSSPDSACGGDRLGFIREIAASAPGVTAGASFATLRATEPLLENKHEWAVIAARFSELAAGMRRDSARLTRIRVSGTIPD